MSLLAAHLEQIASSCDGINSLPFPRPKIFTNALLQNHDITSLIRDTEAHERALFSVPPAQPLPSQNTAAGPSSSSSASSPKPTTNSRRQTVFNVASGEVTAGPVSRGVVGGVTSSAPSSRRRTAVAAVLGGDLLEQLRRGELAARSGGGGDDRGGIRGSDVDVGVLLRGAERLCGVCAPDGAAEHIAQLRTKWANGTATLEYYEGVVAEQAAKLEKMKGPWMGERDDEDMDEKPEEQVEDDDEGMTEEDLRREEEEVRELEAKKRTLELRLKSMDRDLGGLMGFDC